MFVIASPGAARPVGNNYLVAKACSTFRSEGKFSGASIVKGVESILE